MRLRDRPDGKLLSIKCGDVHSRSDKSVGAKFEKKFVEEGEEEGREVVAGRFDRLFARLNYSSAEGLDMREKLHTGCL
jgi:hypothetical protein